MFTSRFFSVPRAFTFKKSIQILIGFVFVCAFAMAFGSSTQAATINVNSTADALTNNGQCTLREALINANNDAATWPDCAAGSGIDTINLPAGTITFAIANLSPGEFEDQNLRGDLDITSSMTINGTRVARLSTQMPSIAFSM